MDQHAFQDTVWATTRELYRAMPWRDEPSLYHVLVSEIMLQQTQVSRVMTKYAEFMQTFPTLAALANASLADVLGAWQGLGYNRRAKYLHLAAKQIVERGEPRTLEELIALPGIGANTAAAIMNYVYEVPVAYVETNIRTVYFHHFFPNHQQVSDKEVLQLVQDTMDTEHPREWFWALMDYGASLKSQGLGRLNASKHYKQQSPLKGSVREVRGQIIRLLTAGPMAANVLMHECGDDARYPRAVAGLKSDGLITEANGMIRLTN